MSDRDDHRADATAPGCGRETLPYTVLSCSVSMDGYISGASGERLLLSNAADFDRVDAVRAACDAILVGAQTIRSDNPRLLVRSRERRAEREARGLSSSPVKVTVTASAMLAPESAFFSTGGGKLVYCPSPVAAEARSRLDSCATVVDGGSTVTMRAVAADLFRRGVRRLMVEGGGTVHTQFLQEDVTDELQLAIAPVFVGGRGARRFVDDGAFPWHLAQRARLVQARQIGDVALLSYALSDRAWARHRDATARLDSIGVR